MSARPVSQIGWPEFAWRLLIIVGYLLLELSVVGAFAFMLGVLTDAPLAAVGGAVLLMILCAILDSITALGSIRDGLPGHYAYAWADALAPTIDYSDMITGALWSIGYAIIAVWFAVLALPAQGHHELRCSAKKASIRLQASSAEAGSGPAWVSFIIGRNGSGPFGLSFRKQWPAAG